METVTTHAKQQFLETYEREHAITMKLLRAYPTDKLDLKPHTLCKTARELAWVFVLERRLGGMLMENVFASGPPSGSAPAAPDSWPELLETLEKAHREFGDLIRSMPEDKLAEPVRFFMGPKTMGDVPRLDRCWFLLHDQIHHRGQFSVYLRMADAKVPSIYGPSLDEPWF